MYLHPDRSILEMFGKGLVGAAVVRRKASVTQSQSRPDKYCADWKENVPSTSALGEENPERFTLR
eukprot:scaffold133976_cov51-Attheya_sp.AAC.3